MCAKQLYVKSNGQWVAAGGAGGSVDTTGLATEQFVTDAIAAIPATDLTGLATLTDLNDALATIPESAITLHEGAVPDAGAETPQGLEDAFAVLDDGLHYFKDVGTLVSITRQEYQTTITLTGQLSSFAKIVKSEAGLPTPQNPSMIVMQTAEGQWLKLTSDELNKPFGNPQRVDIFALTGGTVDLSGYYTKPEVDAALDLKADKTDTYTKTEVDVELDTYFQQADSNLQLVAKTFGDSIALKADKSDTYNKSEVDAKLDADKDFSIANDNVLLASITSLQEIVSNLGGDIGTGQIDVLDAIRDVEIEPSAIKFTGDAMSPIAWKGGLSLAPVKEGDNWKLGWNDGGIVSHLATQADLSGYAPISTTTLITTQLQAVFDSIYTRAESDDRYAKKADNTQNLVVNGMVAKGYTFGDAISTSNPGLVYTDTNEGYGPRLVLDTPGGKELIPYQSDFEPIKERLTTLESKAAPTVDLSPYITQVDADARYGARTAEAVSLLQVQLQSVFDSIYTRAEADDRYVLKSDLTAVWATKAEVFGYVDTKTYTKDQADAKFLTLADIGILVQKDELAPYAKTADTYTKPEIDSKLAVINPIASPSINDPALAAFKKSVLDEVKLMLVGGTKAPPPDIDWTWMVRMDGARESVSTEIQARMIGGFIELKGTLSFGAGSGSWVPLRLPPQFPLAELEASYPLAMRLVGTAVTYGFCTVSNKNRDISCSPGARSSEATFSGIRWKAAY
jgi:hypothetical protein